MLRGINSHRAVRMSVHLVYTCAWLFPCSMAVAENLSLEAIASIQRENYERVANSSYVIRTEHTDGRDPKNVQYASRYHLVRRRGDMFFHLTDDSGFHSSRDDVDRLWQPILHVYAFDGNSIRINSLGRQFAHSFSDSSTGHCGSIGYYEKLLASDRENPNVANEGRPGPHPSGTIAEGLQYRSPKDVRDDYYLRDAFGVPRTHPAIPYHRILTEFVTEPPVWKENLVTVKSSMSSPPEVLMRKYPDLSRKQAEEIYNRYTLELTIDTARGCMVVKAVEFDNLESRCSHIMKDVSLAQDEATGSWYPITFSLESGDGMSYKMVLMDISFRQTPRAVFENVFFDKQPVYDEVRNKNTVYLLRDPSEYHEDRFLEPGLLDHEDYLKLMSESLLDGIPEEELRGTSGTPPQNHPPPASSPVAQAHGEHSRLLRGLVCLAAAFMVGIVALTVWFLVRTRRHGHA